MRKRIWIVLLVLLLLAAGLGGWLLWQRHEQNTHVFVENAVYDRDARFLDLRGQEISVSHYEALRQELPLCDIVWDVPFQGGTWPSDAETIAVTSLTMADVETLDYLTALKTVDAAQCRDYEALAALEARRPELTVAYSIRLGDTDYPRDVSDLSFSQADGAELLERLQYLPNLKSVRFDEDVLPAADLAALQGAYPHIDFSWEKTVLGTAYPSTVTELDFSGTPLTSVDELEAAVPYFPHLQKLVLCDTGLDNETLAAFRDRVRDRCKVVWKVNLGRMDIRTDETTFMPRKQGVNMQDPEMDNLKYCEDMLVVDVGHMGHVKDLQWLYGMPHLQFLVLVETGVTDLTPIGSLKDLIYLELFKSPGITDYAPLVGCTALEDVNVAYTHGDAAVFAQMPWLKNLWVNQTGISPETRALLTEKLPDTHIEFDAGWHMGNGWRDVENYYLMRDLLEMPYYNWGSTKHVIGSRETVPQE
ncbi:MAG: leucine-rich repeat domain-containing protein [Eubacteriales bacterium]|nr:leucine-rich repeat domain-containing protein [Eubacteriales bacterium]